MPTRARARRAATRRTAPTVPAKGGARRHCAPTSPERSCGQQQERGCDSDHGTPGSRAFSRFWRRGLHDVSGASNTPVAAPLPGLLQGLVDLEPRVGDVVQALVWVLLEAAPEQAMDRRGHSVRKSVHFGCRSSTAAIVSDGVSPRNTGVPVSNSKRMQPNAQMSVRLSTACPRACSGLMYPQVPRIMPAAVSSPA